MNACKLFKDTCNTDFAYECRCESYKCIGNKTRIDVYETLCPQQMLVHKGGKIKNWEGECRDVTPTKSLSQNIRVDVNGEVKFL